MDYPELNTLIAWMSEPHEDSGVWSPVDWWPQDLPEEMAETIVELCDPEVRQDLIKLRDELPTLIEKRSQLEAKWGQLPPNDLCRQLRIDMMVLNTMASDIGVDDSPIGTFENLSQLLEFLIELDLNEISN